MLINAAIKKHTEINIDSARTIMTASIKYFTVFTSSFEAVKKDNNTFITYFTQHFNISIKNEHDSK